MLYKKVNWQTDTNMDKNMDIHNVYICIYIRIYTLTGTKTSTYIYIHCTTDILYGLYYC